MGYSEIAGLKSAGYQIPRMNDVLLLMQQREEPKLFLTPGIQVMEKQLLNLREPDNLCSWSKDFQWRRESPRRIAQDRAGHSEAVLP